MEHSFMRLLYTAPPFLIVRPVRGLTLGLERKELQIFAILNREKYFI